MLTGFDETLENSLEKLFEYHEKKALEIKAKIRTIEETTTELQKERDRINQEINQIRYFSRTKNIISIQLENTDAESSKEIELDVAYQVYGAHWRPSYDIRVNTSGKANQMKLTYFGNIHQQTGEDWNDVELQLSTATPGIGGDLPKLGTTTVDFYRPPPPQPQAYLMGNTVARAGVAPSMMRKSVRAEAAPVMFASADASGGGFGVATTVAEEDVLSTSFTIPVKKTIPSDPAEHKVTITVEELKVLLHYHCVPKKSTSVFLTALVTNDSDFPLLAGPASIYLNNSMSTNITMKATSCGEKFECSLGVDKTVKVIYKPTHKYQAQVGMLSKSTTTANEQKIVVKNSKRSEPILITLHEPIPKSGDEKIKVKLLSPEIKPVTGQGNGSEDRNAFKLPEVGYKLDDLNNLLWTAQLNANEEKDFLIKWVIEYPSSETLTFNESRERE